ncbi:MAG TPA: FAD-dependent oxidoreductase [Thermoleophilaceae bacterium]|jgi:3-phenylpropionate/trans-cinnamate dioxygenase ferredoxin reductase subunit
MADRSVDYLLIGGGIACARCAQTLRREGAEGSILVVGREADPAYARPPLSKEYLAGTMPREEVTSVEPEWWEENGVELLTRTSVMKLDTGERVAKLATREEVGFDKALVATGANVRRLRADGGELKGIHYLRSYGNADAIRADAEAGKRAVMIGGSYIGSEVAATLTTAFGVECTILMQEDVCLSPQFGNEVGGYFQGLLESHGITAHGGDSLERYEGEERVARVVSQRGLELDCDFVVVGAGVVPDVMLARSAGLELGESGGIACSSRLETSVPGIYAAGDVAEYDSPLHGRPVRIEHWDVAAEHGKTAARNMLGQDVAHEVVPYFWSDFADWAKLEYVGIGSGERRVIRGSLDDGDFIAFSLDGDRLVAAVTVGRPEDLAEARRLMADRATPDPDALADVSTDLSSL